jgi:hypothetical protein
MSSRVARESGSSGTGSFRVEVFGLRDLCHHFVNPIHHLKYGAPAETQNRGRGSNKR